MAHRTDFPDSDGARETNINGNILVSMGWCNLQVASINHTTPDGRRRVGLVRCRIKIPCPFYQISDPRGKALVADYRVAQGIGLAISQGKPARTYGWFLGPYNTYSSIYTSWCIGNPRDWPNEGRLLKKVCMTFCEPLILRLRNHGSCASCSFSQPLTVSSVGQSL
jgi:hypothetical protein